MSQQINLFNPIFRKQKKYFSANTMAQALGLIFAGAMLVVAYAHYQSRHQLTQSHMAALQLKATQAQLTQLNAEFGIRQKSKALEEKIQKTEAENRALQQVFETLEKGEFGNTQGYSEYLRAFSRQIANGIWLTGFNIQGAGAEIGLQGRTLRPELVPAYIKRLGQEAVMQGKSFATLEMQVPRVEPGNRADPAAAQAAAPAYIEFSLQSSGTASDVVADATKARK